MSATLTSWRDRIKVHPAADLFPMMSDAELIELGKDIAENNQQTPIVLWTPERRNLGSRKQKAPKALYLLDGRNRLEAITRVVTDAEELVEAIDTMLDYRSGGNSWGARLLFEEDGHDPWAYVVSANIRRRHLTAEQKREIIAKLLKANPERSDRATAKIAQVSHPTVAVVRRELEVAGDVENLSTRTDTAGRQQPAHRPPPAAVVHRSSLPPPPSKEEQLRRLREQQVQRTAAPAAAHPDDVMAAFDALVRHLDEHRDDLRHVPLDQLAKAVLSIMARLGITIEMLEEEADRR